MGQVSFFRGRFTRPMGHDVCGTYTKNNQLYILKVLFDIQDQIDKHDAFEGEIPKFDENERYFKMAMKIDPSDPFVLERNENKNNEK